VDPANRRASTTLALISDTFQEARARSLFWGLFGLSTLLICIFLFVLKMDVVAGAVTFIGVHPGSHGSTDVQRFVENSYSWVSILVYIWGTLLAIFASSGLVPSVLEAGRISLLLSKPLTRTRLLLGRYLGNLAVIALNHCYLICSVWVIIGVKTHIWEPRFLLAIPVSVFMFAVLLCVVVLVGVVFESAALSVMVAVALMLVSTILAQKEIVVRLLSSEWSRQLWMAFYWVVPKVYDLGAAMKQLILFGGQTNWAMPIWTSAAFGIAVLWLALAAFRKRDF
jgi:ABC-type transport system involved in multi-copper enzyme maturation permease subunit